MVESRKAKKGLGNVLRSGIAAGMVAVGAAGLQRAEASGAPAGRSADVLLVSFEKAVGKDFQNGLVMSTYESVLRKEGLTCAYVALDSAQTLKTYDHSVDMNSKTMLFTDATGIEQYSVTYPLLWEADKAMLNRVEAQVNPKYVIILGGVNIMPMPLEVTPVHEHHSWEKIYPIDMAPSDDPYASQAPTNRFMSKSKPPKPDYILARIPGDDAGEINSMLGNAVLRHMNPNTSTIISTVEHTFTGKLGNPVADPFYYLTYLTEQYEEGIRKHDHGKSSFVVLPEQLYSISVDGKPGPGKDQLLQHISNSGVQFYIAMGDGMASHVFPDEDHTTVESDNLPILKGRPIVINMGCYNGNIDQGFVDLYDFYKSGSPTLVHAFMINGAAAYIGDTVETAVEWWKVVTPFKQTEGSIPAEISTYANFRDGKTIGEAFLEMKNEYGQSNSKISQSGAIELQLYGDPTLRR